MAAIAPLYIYGLCPTPPAPLALPPGLEGETALVTVGDLAALVEEGLNLAEIQAENARLLRAVLSHDRVLCEIFQQTTILPLRFGTQLPSLDHLKAHLLAEPARYRAKLADLTAKAEYQLKFLPQDLTPPPLTEGLKGRDYFLAKKQRLQDLSAAQQLQQGELQALLDHIPTVYADCVVVEPTDTEAKVYLLVADDQADALAQQLEAWRSQAPHWQLLLSEALPPYHFV